MKKFVCFALCVIIAIAFASCGSKTKDGDVITGDGFDVTFELDSQNSTGSKLRINTSLPLNMKVELTLKAGKDNYLLEQNTEVKGGAGSNYIEVSGLQHKDGSKLNEGRYILMIETKLPTDQSADVVEKIGDDGKNMLGNNVYYLEGQHIAKISKVIKLAGERFTNV